MITDPLVIAVLCALVAWDIGRRFASRGRQVTPEELDHLTDRVVTCEAGLAQINAHTVQIETIKADRAKLVARLDHTASQDEMATLTKLVAEHGRKLTSEALGKVQPTGRPIIRR